MTSRLLLPQELLETGLIGPSADYGHIADAIERGHDREDILRMAELARWPEARTWLKARL
jgi:hypothetical protein